MSAGFVSRSPRVHAVGPFLYLERNGFMLHTWARWFRLPWHHGFKWGFRLRVRDRYVAVWGNR